MFTYIRLGGMDCIIERRKVKNDIIENKTELVIYESKDGILN